MDRDRIQGMGKQVKGKINEVAGAVKGDTSQEIKGKAQQLGGKIQQGYGKVKDELRASKEQHDEKRQERELDMEL